MGNLEFAHALADPFRVKTKVVQWYNKSNGLYEGTFASIPTWAKDAL
jgi:hypothetical protein